MKIEDLFLKLVKIDSPFGQEKKLADFVIKELKKLDLIIKIDKSGNIVKSFEEYSEVKEAILECLYGHLGLMGFSKRVTTAIGPSLLMETIYLDDKPLVRLRKSLGKPVEVTWVWRETKRGAFIDTTNSCS